MPTTMSSSSTRYESYRMIYTVWVIVLHLSLLIITDSEEAEENCDEHDKDCHDEYREKARECAERCEAVAVPINTRKEATCEDKCDATAKDKAADKCEKGDDKCFEKFKKMAQKCKKAKCSKYSCKARWWVFQCDSYWVWIIPYDSCDMSKLLYM